MPDVPRQLIPLVLIVGLVATVSACGLRADERPQLIPRERLDASLFQEGRGATYGSHPATIYVLSSQDRTSRLVPVQVPVPSGPDEARAVLETLLTWAAPADPTVFPRLSSIIPYGTTLRAARRDGDVLTIDLDNLNIEGTGQTQALAQLVYTATEMDGIRRVRFNIGGKPVAVPLEERSSAPGELLGRDDFSSLRPVPTTTRPPVDPAAGTTQTAPP